MHLLHCTNRCIASIVIAKLLNQTCASQRPACAWFLEIAFVREVSMHARVCVCVCVCVRVCACLCVSTLKAINYILVILNLCNQLNKFVAFRM